MEDITPRSGTKIKKSNTTNEELNIIKARLRKTNNFTSEAETAVKISSLALLSNKEEEIPEVSEHSDSPRVSIALEESSYTDSES